MPPQSFTASLPGELKYQLVQRSLESFRENLNHPGLHSAGQNRHSYDWEGWLSVIVTLGKGEASNLLLETWKKSPAFRWCSGEGDTITFLAAALERGWLVSLSVGQTKTVKLSNQKKNNSIRREAPGLLLTVRHNRRQTNKALNIPAWTSWHSAERKTVTSLLVMFPHVITGSGGKWDINKCVLQLFPNWLLHGTTIEGSSACSL